MSGDTYGGVRRRDGHGHSARSLSTMNLITLSWLLASEQAAVLPNADVGRCLDATVQRTSETHASMQ